MPTSTVWLDDDHNVVDRDQATFAVEKETDDQGRLVRERWIRIVRPDSPEADQIAIEREAQRIAAAMPGPGAGPSRALWMWGIILALVLGVVIIWLLFS